METAKFCRVFDRFFDCMNTRSLSEGRQKRKPDLEPYRSHKDSRLAVSIAAGVHGSMFMSMSLTYSGWKVIF